MEYLLVAVALFLAFGNGANDNFKGFATVWGSDSLSYRQALILATLATVAGSLMSLYLANGLVQQFSGKGLLPALVVDAPRFIASVGLAAALTVIIATRAGLPISTTHALLGGLVGAGLAASPGELQFARLANTFVLPLLLSPVLAAVLGWLAWRLLLLRRADTDCACVIAPPVLAVTSGSVLQQMTAPQLVMGSNPQCDQLAAPLARLAIARMLNRLHIFSASLICFARAVNDTPKLAALLVAAHLLNAQTSIAMIAALMALGGVLLSRRVAETMSRRVSRMDPTQGLSANLITATLVLGASQFGLPVSTTHVSVGAIAGVGSGADTLNKSALRTILLSWVATLPMAAGLAWLAHQLF
ncbi:inorganic phosphate transporter [Polaromonas sp.]|uniref:inorganic phosphate transporter n=1 Tax=Polaromonas sp. TaxID=1869339 RepID=UPI002730D393|nr:inorganic phosphate transporter [Polaromonas sp.]MDP1739765.1 inorganic phosphate transporter [Polaromonas sp.]